MRAKPLASCRAKPKAAAEVEKMIKCDADTAWGLAKVWSESVERRKICGEARAGGVYIEASGEREAPAGSEPFSALALIWRRRRAAGERRVWKGEGG